MDAYKNGNKIQYCNYYYLVEFNSIALPNQNEDYCNYYYLVEFNSIAVPNQNEDYCNYYYLVEFNSIASLTKTKMTPREQVPALIMAIGKMELVH